MSDNLFCEEGDAEWMADSEVDVVDTFFDGGVYPDHPQPLIVEEWSARDTRAFLHDDHVLDSFVERLCEFHLEEQMDEDGVIWDKLFETAKKVEVREKFTSLLDDLFAGVHYRWADKLVARWEVRWTVPPDLGNDSFDQIDMSTVTYERKEVTK